MTGEVRPEPVVDEAKVASTVSGAVVAVVGLVLLVVSGRAGDLTTLQLTLEGVLTAVMAAAAVVAPIWRARKARDKVTPLEDPRTVDGKALVVAEYVVDPQTPGVADHAAPEEPEVIRRYPEDGIDG